MAKWVVYLYQYVGGGGVSEAVYFKREIRIYDCVKVVFSLKVVFQKAKWP